MFKAVNNLREQKGFTLIELLIVIAIIGILAAIAIPAFLGQREKAKIRAVLASAKGSVSEVQGILDAYVAGEPFILLDSGGQEVCYQATSAAGTAKSCGNMYQGMAPAGTYADPPAGIDSVKQWIIDHHAGKAEKSPYYGNTPLFVSKPKDVTADYSGQVAVSNITGRSFQIWAWGECPSSPCASSAFIFNTIVTAR